MELKRATDRIELTSEEAMELVLGSGRVRGDDIEVAVPETEQMKIYSKLDELND